VARVGDEVRVGGGPASLLGAVVDADERRLREIRERCPGNYIIVGGGERPEGVTRRASVVIASLGAAFS
jgi:hypothetical protein